MIWGSVKSKTTGLSRAKIWCWSYSEAKAATNSNVRIVIRRDEEKYGKPDRSPEWNCKWRSLTFSLLYNASLTTNPRPNWRRSVWVLRRKAIPGLSAYHFLSPNWRSPNKQVRAAWRAERLLRALVIYKCNMLHFFQSQNWTSRFCWKKCNSLIFVDFHYLYRYISATLYNLKQVQHIFANLKFMILVSVLNKFTSFHY